MIRLWTHAVAIVCALLLLASVSASANRQAVSQADWDRADRELRRAAPNEFPNLPDWLVTALNRRRCRIPQSTLQESLHNIISGRFNDGDVPDWAVLCSRDRISVVLVYFDSDAQRPSEFLSAADSGYFQNGGGGSIEYSRAITVATPETIRHYQGDYRQFVARHPTHDGIEAHFLEKASTIWYRPGSIWLMLLGAD